MVYFALRAIDRGLFLQTKSNQAKKEILCPSTVGQKSYNKTVVVKAHLLPAALGDIYEP